MTFETVTTPEGERVCFVDGINVPAVVFDTLMPAKLFPVDTGLSYETALAEFECIRANAPTPPPRTTPYFSTAITGAKPLRSNALAIHSKQREAVMARNKRHGVNVEYDRLGRPVFTDAGQRRALMKLEGVRQMNSAYGA